MGPFEADGTAELRPRVDMLATMAKGPRHSSGESGEGPILPLSALLLPTMLRASSPSPTRWAPYPRRPGLQADIPRRCPMVTHTPSLLCTHGLSMGRGA